MPFNSRSSNGTETFANRFVQYGLIWWRVCDKSTFDELLYWDCSANIPSRSAAETKSKSPKSCCSLGILSCGSTRKAVGCRCPRFEGTVSGVNPIRLMRLSDSTAPSTCRYPKIEHRAAHRRTRASLVDSFGRVYAEIPRLSRAVIDAQSDRFAF